METPKNESKPPRSKTEYSGGSSTLCTGCGHDLITSSIISAYSELQIDPYDIIKMSGIGCSSKTPGYFIGVAQGINSMHGRMAPVATGALVIRPHKYFIGVSGDGDTASIGLGGFCHLIRRNPRMVYIVANNGVYGLTKGQFSPTAEKSAVLKSGERNHFSAIDICKLSLTLGCGFVARAYVGDQKQLISILKSAIQFDGLAIIDVISPCITFNNHDGSQMSYKYVKSNQETLNTIDFSDHISIKKVSHLDHDVTDAQSALTILDQSHSAGHVLTGLFHRSSVNYSLCEELNLESTQSLADLTEADLRPSQDEFKNLMKGYY